MNNLQSVSESKNPYSELVHQHSEGMHYNSEFMFLFICSSSVPLYRTYWMSDFELCERKKCKQSEQVERTVVDRMTLIV